MENKHIVSKMYKEVHQKQKKFWAEKLPISARITWQVLAYTVAFGWLSLLITGTLSQFIPIIIYFIVGYGIAAIIGKLAEMQRKKLEKNLASEYRHEIVNPLKQQIKDGLNIDIDDDHQVLATTVGLANSRQNLVLHDWLRILHICDKKMSYTEKVEHTHTFTLGGNTNQIVIKKGDDRSFVDVGSSPLVVSI